MLAGKLKALELSGLIDFSADKAECALSSIPGNPYTYELCLRQAPSVIFSFHHSYTTCSWDLHLVLLKSGGLALFST